MVSGVEWRELLYHVRSKMVSGGRPAGGAGGGGAGAGDDDDDDPSSHEVWMVPASKEQGAVRLLVVTDQDQLGRRSWLARVTRAKVCV